jgi:hypothetical protein
VARLHSSVGWVLMELGRTREARAHYEQSRSIRERLLGADHPSLTSTWNELGHLAEERGEPLEAVRCFERSREIGLASLRTDPASTLKHTINLAGALALAERFDDAVPLLDAAQRVFDDSKTEPFAAARIELSLGRARVALGKKRPDEAVRAARASHQLGVEAFGAEHPEALLSLPVLAEALEASGQPAEALSTLDAYLAAASKKGPCETAECAGALVHGGRAQLSLSRPKEALARLEKGLERADAVEGNERLKAEGRLLVAQAVWASHGDGARAKALAEDARARFVALGRAADAQAAEALLARHRKD